MIPCQQFFNKLYEPKFLSLSSVDFFEFKLEFFWATLILIFLSHVEIWAENKKKHLVWLQIFHGPPQVSNTWHRMLCDRSYPEDFYFHSPIVSVVFSPNNYGSISDFANGFNMSYTFFDRNVTGHKNLGWHCFAEYLTYFEWLSSSK